MSVLLQDKAKNLDLASKPCAAIGLGDDRYFYTARAVHAAGVMAPRFEVDPTWPKPLPNHWLMGETIGVSATATIISWIILRAASLAARDDESSQCGVLSSGPTSTA